MKNNILYVAHGEEDRLYSKGLLTGKINFIPSVPDKKEFCCNAKFRYRQDEQKVFVKLKDDGSAEVEFAERQRAITEGQYCVFYDDEKCLGGGVIEKALF